MYNLPSSFMQGRGSKDTQHIKLNNGRYLKCTTLFFGDLTL